MRRAGAPDASLLIWCPSGAKGGTDMSSLELDEGRMSEFYAADSVRRDEEDKVRAAIQRLVGWRIFDDHCELVEALCVAVNYFADRVQSPEAKARLAQELIRIA